MATIDVSQRVLSYVGTIKWLEAHVGQYVQKGENSWVLIFESDKKTIYRTFGIGWHFDYIYDEDMFHRVVYIYDEMKAMVAKLTLEAWQLYQ